MERIQSRRRINERTTHTQENEARIAAKPIVPKPAARPALGDVGNRNVAAKANALQKPAVKPVATVRTVFGIGNQKKPPTLLKPALKKPAIPAKQASIPVSTTAPAKAVQVRKTGSVEVVKARIVPALQSIRHKDIASAIGAGQVIRRTSEGELDKVVYDVDLEADPQLVCEYVNDIMSYLLQLECKYPISKLFLTGHKVTAKHRSVLVNWLAEVSDSFRLVRETFHMTIALIDRYLEKNRTVNKDNLQLVGIVAVLVAHKYEQTEYIDLDDFVYICDNAYTKQDMLKMEIDMLAKMDFCLGRPTAITFLRRYNKVAAATPKQHEFGKFFIDLALMEYEFCAVRPSVQAAAACCLARWLTGGDGDSLAAAWSDLLEHYSRYKFAQIEATVRRFAAMVVRSEGARLQMIRKIYADTKTLCISKHELLRSERLKTLAATAS